MKHLLRRLATTLGLTSSVIMIAAGAAAGPGSYIQKFADPTGAQDDQFGYSVKAVDGIVVVGSPVKAGGGAVLLFDPVTTEPLATLPLPEGYTPGRFGHALATTGSQLLVSDTETPITGNRKGAVLLYDSVTDIEPEVLPNPETEEDGHFGASIAFGPNGLIAVGSPRRESGSGSGQVAVYSAAALPHTHLYNLAVSAGGHSFEPGFGTSVAFSHDGRLAVGSPTQNSVFIFDGATGAFERTLNSGPYTSDFGHKVHNHGHELAIPYQTTPTNWVPTVYISIYDWATGAHKRTTYTHIHSFDNWQINLATVGGQLIGGYPTYGQAAGLVFTADPYFDELYYGDTVSDFGHALAGLGDDVLVGAPAFTIIPTDPWTIRPIPAVYLLSRVKPPVSTPAAPSNLQVVSVAANQLQITFADNSDNEAGFSIERRSDDSGFQEIAQLFPNTTSYLDTTVTDGTAYCYRVKAFNDLGEAYTDELCTVAGGANGPDLIGSANAIVYELKRKDKLVGSVTVRNQGDAPAPRSVAAIYVSDDAQLDDFDTLLKKIRIPRLDPGQETTKNFRKSYKGQLDGKTIFVVLDDKESVTETIEINNRIVVGPLLEQ